MTLTHYDSDNTLELAYMKIALAALHDTDTFSSPVHITLRQITI